MASDLLYASLLSTETASTENRDPEDDDLVAMGLTTLHESGGGEGTDPDEGGSLFTPAHIAADLPVMITTMTKANGDPAELDDDEDEAVFAMATTNTEQAGDPESDPEDNAVRAFLSGNTKPLLYRFSEPGLNINPNICYDAVAQLHMLADGRVALTAVKDRVRARR